MANNTSGIDLGTTYSCIATVDEDGRAVVINNMEGTSTTPSVVNFASPEKVVVGQVAKETAVIDPNNTVAFVKNLMGKTNYVLTYNGEDRSPEEVSSYILRKVCEDAEKLTGKPVKDVVITCPAYFGDAERKATENAGRMAGLNVLEIISEPTAAAIYYGCTRVAGEKVILVYDLGGGTFDVTIMKISDGEIVEVCKDGDHDLGGKLWDDAVIRYLTDKFVEETNYDGEIDEYAMQDLRIKAERAKQQLSAREEVPVMLDIAGMHTRITLTRATFDEITSDLLNRSIDIVDAAISVAEDKGVKVDEIVLVGGSTYMPQVPNILREKYGLEPRILDPNEAVAKGAAIYAASLVGDDDFRIGGGSGPIKIRLVTNKSYALKVLKNGQEVCLNMIVKNEPMGDDNSVSVTKQFGTAEANQRAAELVVYESDIMEEYFEVDEDYVLGKALLELPGNLPENAPIQVTFTLDKEGKLSVTGRDMTSGNEIHAEMQTNNGVSEEEINRVINNNTSIKVE